MGVYQKPVYCQKGRTYYNLLTYNCLMKVSVFVFTYFKTSIRFEMAQLEINSSC